MGYIFYYKQFQLRAYMHLTDDWVLSSIGKKFPKCMKVATKNDPQLFPCWLFKWDVFQIMTIAVSWQEIYSVPFASQFPKEHGCFVLTDIIFLTASHQGLSAAAVHSAFLTGTLAKHYCLRFLLGVMAHCLILCSNVFLTYVSHSFLVCILQDCSLFYCTHQCALYFQDRKSNV